MFKTESRESVTPLLDANGNVVIDTIVVADK